MARVFTIRRKVFQLFGAAFHIYDHDDKLIGYSKQKAFKLKEDIRVYTDETMSDERLTIQARSIIDFSAAYDVVDARTGEKLGAFRRQGLKSILRDSWVVMDTSDNEIGKIEEDSILMATLRRFVGFIPQHFHLRDSSGAQLADMRTHFNPFVHRLTVTIEDDCPLHPLLMLAAGVLLVAIEGRQS